MPVPVTFVIFDVLRCAGIELTNLPYAERRVQLESLSLEGPAWTTSETFEDGAALFHAVCQHGLEGVVSKRLSSRYTSNVRGWIKFKNPNWRRELEREAMVRSRERRARVRV